MRLSRKRAASALAVLALVSLVVAALASSAPAAKPAKPGRVIVSADVLWRDACAPPWIAAVPGHIEVNAVDLDPSTPPYSWSSQNDRISATVSYGDRTNIVDAPLRVEMLGGGGAWDAGIFFTNTLVLVVRDGGNPGVQNDSIGLGRLGGGLCPSPQATITDGNVKITAAG